MNILHIDSSMMQSDSITRELSASIVAQIKISHPHAQVTYRDLVKNEVTHLTQAIAAGFRNTGLTDFDHATLKEHQLSEQLVTEFLASDFIVIGAPMYNFSVPTQLKSWLDRLAQVGRTFSYTANGPVGLASGKRIIVASARGGFYANTAIAFMDFQESYLKAFFAFMGIRDIHFVSAEGASKGEQVKAEGIRAAKDAIPAALINLTDLSAHTA
ncbi:FMN-dependent NADH-azoreductase [Methylophilus sp. 5]|uniref:FMN-dependent NADH-azoreductase n=1 Tax=Methylophilus sp. 5 TaxID=1112274 RepID=UPI00048C5065|nr:NAD(P)H-dependent oxidoreductase [Methylophilus sp. 5]